MKEFKEYLEQIELFSEGKTTDAGIRTIAKEMEYGFKSAKRIWKKIYKSALKQYDGDEGKAIATAHAGLKQAIKAKRAKKAK